MSALPYNVFINSKCNLNCPYCFAKEVCKNDSKEISLSNFLEIVNFYKNSDHYEIALLGGEPTLHPYFTKILDVLVESGFKISIKSNSLWSSEIGSYITKLPVESTSFLLNINNPSFYTKAQYCKIIENISSIKMYRIILSVNIDSEIFNYEYALDICRKFNIKFLRWSFAHPIYPIHVERNQKFFPINKYKNVVPQILKLISECDKLNIRTMGDHSVVRCMFKENEIKYIESCGGEINCLCEGTIDVLPNLQIIYCLPLFNLFNPIYLNDFSSLNEIELYFESRISKIRSKSLPFNDCINCQYLNENKCHAGCISHRVFADEDLDEMIIPWTVEKLKAKILMIPEHIEFKNNGDEIIVENKINNNIVEINFDTYDILIRFDGKTLLEEIIINLNASYDTHTKNNEFKINNFLETCKTYSLLEIKK